MGWDIIPDYLENPSAFAESEYVDFYEIGLALAASGFGGLIFILTFSILRRRSNAYEPRTAVQPERTLPPLPKYSVFGWVHDVLAVQEDDILRTAGLDAVVHLRTYYMALRIFAIFSLYAFAVLLPINFTGGSEDSLNDFQLWSLSNVASGSSRMWFHVLGMYILTYIVMWELYHECQYFIALRHEFLLGEKARMRTVLVEKIPPDLQSQSKTTAYFETMYHKAVSNSHLCQDIRRLESAIRVRESVLSWLERHLRQRELQGREQYHMLAPGRYTNSVQYYSDMLVTANARVARELKRARASSRRVDKEAALPSSTYIQNLMRVHRASLKDAKEKGGDKVKTSYGSSDESEGEEEEEEEEVEGEDEEHKAQVEAPEGRLHRFRAMVTRRFRRLISDTGDVSDHEQKRLIPSAPAPKRVMLSKAFVTFRTYAAATLARQVLHAAIPGAMVVEEAREPVEIIWSNFYVTRTSRTYRIVVGETFTILLLAVYIVPVTLVAIMVAPDSLSARYAWVESAYNSSFLFRTIISTIQPICLIMLMNLLPPLFFAIGYLEGRLAYSDIVQATFRRYYAFQVINVFLVTTIAGSLVDSLVDIVQDPSETFYLLGQSLPKVAGFFCEYMLFKAFFSLPLDLSRIVHYLQALIKRHLTWHLTRREKRAEYLGCRDLMKPYWFNYGKFVAQDQLVVLVAMTYAVVAPLILIPCLLFFCMSVLIYRHQLLYVYETFFEMGGMMWPKIFYRYIFAMFIAQATLIGVLALKSAYHQCYIVGLLFVQLVAFTIIVNEIYIQTAYNLPLELAKSVDHQRDTLHSGDVPGTEDFIQPALRVPVEAEPETQPPPGQPFLTQTPTIIPPDERGKWYACC